MTESICNGCRESRKTWSDELAEKGYLGCNLLNIYCFETKWLQEGFVLENVKAEIVATGWVDLNRRPGEESSGHLCNEQLITKGTAYCSKFEKDVSK